MKLEEIIFEKRMGSETGIKEKYTDNLLNR